MQLAAGVLADGPDRILERLSSVRFETILGPVAFDADKKNSVNRFGLYQWNGKNFELLN